MEGFQHLKDKYHYRSSHQNCSERRGVLSNFAKFTGKYLCQSLFFNKVKGFSLWKVRLWRRCFHVNFVKFLRTPFLQNRTPLGEFYSASNPEKDVQCFLSSVVSKLWKINTIYFLEKDIDSTQVTAKLIALTLAINYFEKCFRHKTFRVYRGQEDRE